MQHTTMYTQRHELTALEERFLFADVSCDRGELAKKKVMENSHATVLNRNGWMCENLHPTLIKKKKKFKVPSKQDESCKHLYCSTEHAFICVFKRATPPVFDDIQLVFLLRLNALIVSCFRQAVAKSTFFSQHQLS